MIFSLPARDHPAVLRGAGRLFVVAALCTACSSTPAHSGGTSPGATAAGATTASAGSVADDPSVPKNAATATVAALADPSAADDAVTDAWLDSIGLRTSLGDRAEAVYAELRTARRAAFGDLEALTVTDNFGSTTTAPTAPATTGATASGGFRRTSGNFGSERALLAPASNLALTFGLQFSEMFAASLDRMTSTPGFSGEVQQKLADNHPPAPVDDGKETTTTNLDVTVTVGAFGSVVSLRLDGSVTQTVVDDTTQAVIAEVTDARSYTGKIDVCPSSVGEVPGSLAVGVRIQSQKGSTNDLDDSTLSGHVDDSAALTGVEVTSEDNAKWTRDGGTGSVDVKVTGAANPPSSGVWDISQGTWSVAGVGDTSVTDVGHSGSNIEMNVALMQPVYDAAQKLWRNGRCVVVTAPDYEAETPIDVSQQHSVQHNEDVDKSSETDFSVDLRHRFDSGKPVAPIEATLAGDDKLEPDHADSAPISLTYTAGDKDDDKATVTLTSTSRRGIGTLVLQFTVKPKKLALAMDGTFSVAASVVSLTVTAHATSTQFEPTGGGNYRASLPVTTTGHATFAGGCGSATDTEGGGNLVFDAKIVKGPDKKPVWQVTLDPGASNVNTNLLACGMPFDNVVDSGAGGGVAGAIASAAGGPLTFPTDGGTVHISQGVIDVTFTATVPE